MSRGTIKRNVGWRSDSNALRRKSRHLRDRRTDSSSRW